VALVVLILAFMRPVGKAGHAASAGA
jgi:hypothetical protein